jgi:hypothetical protein
MVSAPALVAPPVTRAPTPRRGRNEAGTSTFGDSMRCFRTERGDGARLLAVDLDGALGANALLPGLLGAQVAIEDLELAVDGGQPRALLIGGRLAALGNGRSDAVCLFLEGVDLLLEHRCHIHRFRFSRWGAGKSADAQPAP